MTLQQYLAIAVAFLLLVVLPAVVVWQAWRYHSVKASDRPTHVSLAVGFLNALDRIVRPSVEYRIEEENRVVKDEDDVGEDV